MTFNQTAASALSALSLHDALPISVSSAPMSAAKPNFDGAWSVLIVTEQGKCDRAYRYAVKIENGSVGYAGSASFTVTGKVGTKGDVIVTVARGSQSATGTGAMSGT